MQRVSVHVLLMLAFSIVARGEMRERSKPPAITVYTQFEHAASATSIEMMRKELEAIMLPLGLDFTWRDLHASTGSEVSVELVVVTFKGTCQIDDGIQPHGETGALGWTHISDGAILPFSDVDCDKISRFISADLRGVDPADREIVYGRAIGRVLAHELYHIFTNTTRHASWGVAKAFYTPLELVSDRFTFQEKDNMALRRGKLRSLLQSQRPAMLGFAKTH